MSFKQAERLPTDGPVHVQVDGDHIIIATESPPGMPFENHALRVSFFNAARIFGMLALFLGIKLSAAVGKAIRL